jgi:ADP-heptose:LPS heptosyltransferase
MDLHSAKRILLCLRYGIGDLVMELPAMTVLRETATQAHITALGARPAIELLERDPRLDALACVQDLGLRHWGDTGTPVAQASVAQWLTGGGFEVILDPSHAVFAVRDAIWSLPGPLLLDSGTDGQHDALGAGRGGLAAIKAAVASCWGLRVPADLPPRLYLSPEERDWAQSWLLARGLAEAPLVAVSPVASSPLKRWPVEHLAAVADTLVERHGCRVLVLCGPQREEGAAVVGTMRHHAQAAVLGALHLQRIAALLARCRLFVGNDTGLMHLAGAVATPVVAVFGPTAAAIYLPAGERTQGVDTPVHCPVRHTQALGPPLCVTSGQCLAERRSCIDEVALEDVTCAAQALLCDAH